jgi:hypothetical protein
LALTEKRLRDATSTPVPALPARKSNGRQLSRSIAVTLIVAWAVGFPLALALEPTPADVGAVPWWSFFIEIGLLTSIAAAFVGLAKGMRSGAGASFVAASIFTAGVFACPATGHHAIGLWWIGEFAIALSLVALSARAYLRS